MARPAAHTAARPAEPPVTVDQVLEQLEAVRRNGEGRWMARCPAHGDRSASLSVREGDDGRVLLHCFSGCTFLEVVAALRLEPQQLFPPAAEPWRPTAPRHDPQREARALLERLRALHSPVAPDRLAAELDLIGRLILGGPRAFAELPPGFTAARLQAFPLRMLFLAMTELVKQGTPRRWFSPLALRRELDRASAIWGAPGTQHHAFAWARLAIRQVTP